MVFHRDGADPRCQTQGADRDLVAESARRGTDQDPGDESDHLGSDADRAGYRHRWTGTETFHRDGKQQFGMGDCQLRDPQGQTRHMYLVMLAYSLLMSELKQGRAKEWALHG